LCGPGKKARGESIVVFKMQTTPLHSPRSGALSSPLLSPLPQDTYWRLAVILVILILIFGLVIPNSKPLTPEPPAKLANSNPSSPQLILACARDTGSYSLPHPLHPSLPPSRHFDPSPQTPLTPLASSCEELEFKSAFCLIAKQQKKRNKTKHNRPYKTF
jgi:hypothetical protein